MVGKQIINKLKDTTNLTLVSHNNPDVDAILSLNLFSKVLKSYKINYKIVLLTEPDFTTKAIIKRNQLSIFQEYKKEIKKEDKLFCLDCFTLCDYESQIIGCIDHHPTKLKNNYIIHDNGYYSSTTKRIFDLFIENNPLFKEDYKEFAIQTLYSIYIDTNSLKSSKFNILDNKWISETIQKYSLDEKQLIEEGFCFTDLSLTTKELILNGYKNYYLPNKKSAIISYLILKETSEKLINNLLLEMKKYKKENKIDYFWMILYEIEKDLTILLIVKNSKIQIKKYNCILSRSIDVYPLLEKQNMK